MPSQCWRTVFARLRKGLRRLRAAPATPPVKFTFGNVALRAGVDSLERLTQTHRAAKFAVLTGEIFTLLLPLLAQVPGVAAQAPQRTFELGSLTLKLAAHLIECLAGQHHEMKLVEHDSGLRKVLCRPLDVSRTHVHGNGLDLGGIATVLAQGIGKGSKGLRAASLYH